MGTEAFFTFRSTICRVHEGPLGPYVDDYAAQLLAQGYCRKAARSQLRCVAEFKTTVMAMLIAWQTINAVRRPQSKRFTRGFLVVAPGLTIKDRLRVLQPNDPDSYYGSRELIPADMACNRITAGITRRFVGEKPIKAVLDPYNPTGSTAHVRFNTSKTLRWETDVRRCHVNWVVLDSDWEAEFCRVAESHPRVRAYVKNHNLGLEVPYRYGSETRKYLPDFIVLVDDGHGENDLLHLIVEIKGYRREDAKEKKSTMDTYWVPGVNHLGTHGRWAFAEFTEVYQIEADFEKKVETEFGKMIDRFALDAAKRPCRRPVSEYSLAVFRRSSSRSAWT